MSGHRATPDGPGWFERPGTVRPRHTTNDLIDRAVSLYWRNRVQLARAKLSDPAAKVELHPRPEEGTR